MNLSKEVKDVLAYINTIEVPDHLSPQEAGRAFYEKFIPLAGEKEPVFEIIDQEINHNNDTICFRIYRPSEQDNLPAIMYFHGGWFNAGNLETHDTPLRQLANLTHAVIISVGYRLAPEHPFPAGLQDVEFATRWVIDHATSINMNTHQLFVAGDSAGGALAATITRKFRENIMGQLLIYPVTDNQLNSPSWSEFQHGPLLDLKGGLQAWEWYLPNQENQNDQDAIPLLANDLGGLPPTFIAVAGLDPLRDEAIQYAEKLQSNGVRTTLKVYPSTIHGFFQMGGYFSVTNVLMQDLTEFLTTQLAVK